MGIQGTLLFGPRYAPLPSRLLFGLGGGAFMFPTSAWVDLAGLAVVSLAVVLLRVVPPPAERGSGRDSIGSWAGGTAGGVHLFQDQKRVVLGQGLSVSITHRGSRQL